MTDSAGAVGQRCGLTRGERLLEGSMRSRVQVSAPYMTPYIMSNARSQVLTRQIQHHRKTDPD